MLIWSFEILKHRRQRTLVVSIDNRVKLTGSSQQLVQAARFFTLPSVIGAPARGAADYQQYILTIEEGGRQHTIRVLVPVEDEPLHELVRAVQRHAKTARAAGSDTPSTPKVRKPRR